MDLWRNEMKILALSGFVPEEICDVVRFSQYPGERNISFYCGYASDFISQVLNDDSINGAVYPRTCDSSRIITSYLESSKKFFYQFNMPARQDQEAISYLAIELKRYKDAIEKYFCMEINDIKERIKKINERNSQLKKIYDNLDNIDYYSYLDMIHNNLKRPLFQQNVHFNLPKQNANHKKIYLVGSYLSNIEIARLIERLGMKIIGDNLPESGRLISTGEIDIEGNIYNNISQSLIEKRLSPSQNNFHEILRYDLEEIKRKKVNGVIMIVQKYCEPYEFLYSIYKKMLDKERIPLLKLTVLNSEDMKKIKLQLEAFTEMI